jgi:RNA polymerase sigma-70 factor (ECF subfamily)
MKSARPICTESKPNLLDGAAPPLSPKSAGLDERRIEDLIKEARASRSGALGQLLDACRSYLMRTASRAVGAPLKIKVAPSDLVQETALDAYRDFEQFRGERLNELVAWLRAILMHNVATAGRRYQVAEKRELGREISLEVHLAAAGDLKDAALSPRSWLAGREEQEVMQRAIERLSADQRTVILLRHREQLSFSEIGDRLGRSMSAAHKLWCRGLVRLQRELLKSDECD